MVIGELALEGDAIRVVDVGAIPDCDSLPSLNAALAQLRAMVADRATVMAMRPAVPPPPIVSAIDAIHASRKRSPVEWEAPHE